MRRSSRAWLAVDRACLARRTNRPPRVVLSLLNVLPESSASRRWGFCLSMFFRRYLFFVLFQRHQVIEGCLRFDLDLRHPAFAVGVFGNFRGIVEQLLVDLGDLAVDRRVKVADGLDGFDLAEALADKYVIADLRELDVDDV